MCGAREPTLPVPGPIPAPTPFLRQGFMGPNYSIATACATANYCFTAAANHIRSGRADVMLAGGSEASVHEV